MTRNTSQVSDADVARKMFFGGCLALPWLWAVNCYYFRQHIFSGPQSNPSIQKWVRKSFIGCIIMTLALMTWVIIFQTGWRNWGKSGTNLLLIIPNQELTGW